MVPTQKVIQIEAWLLPHHDRPGSGSSSVLPDKWY